MPELLTFRAVLKIGQYDTPSESVFDGPAALADFEEAILFADSAAKPILKGQLAAARFALQDYHGALMLYQSLAQGTNARLSRFQIARCNFAMSRLEPAKDICRDMVREEMHRF